MAPTHPFADTVSARTLPPGTCLDRVPIDFARVLPCDQSHIAEIVAVIPYASSPGAAFPSTNDLFGFSLDRCKSEFNAYTATTLDRIPASYFVAVPAKWEWEAGDRLVVCYATGRDGGALTTSVRGGPR